MLVLEFGSGRVGVGAYNSDFGSGVVFEILEDSQDIGSKVKSETNDFPLCLNFLNKESLDVLVGQLLSIRDSIVDKPGNDKFPVYTVKFDE
jgi:hypothetical protein